MDKSGLQSLAGFCFQIKVYIYYLSNISERDIVAFEKNDDIEVESEEEKQLEQLVLKQSLGSKIHLIQVKKTNIDKESKNKIIYNWMLATVNPQKNSKYTLYTKREYKKALDLKTDSVENLYKSIESLSPDPKSIIYKIKEKFPTYESFEIMYNHVTSHYEVKSSKDIDQLIYHAYKDKLLAGSISKEIYSARLNSLIRDIQYEILASVQKIEPYTVNYSKMHRFINECIVSINEDVFRLNYVSFRKQHIPFIKQKYLDAREYLQLSACYPQESKLNDLEEHLVYMQYYEEFRFQNMRSLKNIFVEDVEHETFTYFKEVLDDIDLEILNDTPILRLKETKKLNYSNSYLKHIPGSKFLSSGTCIFLTKESTENYKKISWRD